MREISTERAFGRTGTVQLEVLVREISTGCCLLPYAEASGCHSTLRLLSTAACRPAVRYFGLEVA